MDKLQIKEIVLDQYKIKLEDFQHLYEIFIELFGEKNIFYFDEIQNIIEWERFIRRLHDNRKKIIISGSNASMLSKELGTHLTGRYLVKGGLPEYLKTDNVEYLKILYENILYKDIIVRYKLPNERVLKELVNYIAANIAKEISYNSIKNLLQIGSATSVKDYFNYFENTYLIFLLPCFNYSLKKQIYLSKKVYLIDNALIINLGFRLSRDGGRLLENLVFIELKRKNKELYFFKEKNECDFVIKEQNKITQAIQVCYDLNEENIKPIWKWLLED